MGICEMKEDGMIYFILFYFIDIDYSSNDTEMPAKVDA